MFVDFGGIVEILRERGNDTDTNGRLLESPMSS